MYNNNCRHSNNRTIEQTIKNNGHNEQWQCTIHDNNNDQQQWLQQTMKYIIQMNNNAHWTTRIVTNPWCTLHNEQWTTKTHNQLTQQCTMQTRTILWQ